LPSTTTRSTSRSKENPAIRDAAGFAPFSGSSFIVTGPSTRAQQAIRVFGASPTVRTIHTTATAMAAARSAHVTAAGEDPLTASTNDGPPNQ
jgi:hypothetical protein